jgi:hypothetical protein
LTDGPIQHHRGSGRFHWVGGTTPEETGRETTVKHTIEGRTGRAQITIQNEKYRVRLLPKGAHRSTSFTTAGDQVYFGPNLDMALMHVSAWTGIENIELPESFRIAQ